MTSRLRVDLAALTANYRTYQEAGGTAREVGAVVKADAYGLGAHTVSSALAAAGCKRFFVATAVEGRQLRESLPDATIYVFEGAHQANAGILVSAGLIPVINHAAQLQAWQAHRKLAIAVQVDTGMSRLGFTPDVQPGVFEGFQINLLLTHFACADTPEHPLNKAQIQRFDAVAGQFPGVPTSIGNSAGWLLGTRFQGDVGRPGIGLYGANPYDSRDVALARVARFEGRVLQVRTVAAGQSIGYGATATAREDLTVAIVGVGYADGVPRKLSHRGCFAFKNQRCPILGRISMDLTAVDISACSEPPGLDDWLECFGEEVSINEVAAWAETISYEVLTGIHPRVERQYQEA
jgi:alanine racemase